LQNTLTLPDTLPADSSSEGRQPGGCLPNAEKNTKPNNTMQSILKYTLALGIAVGLVTSISQAADASKPKYTIKEVMKELHKAPQGTDPVCKKASNGAASKEEIAKLVEYYKSLPAQKPPQGDEASWKEKSTALLKAAEALHAGKPDAVKQYSAAVNCKACHSVHKPQ